ncbi:DUF6314 family protein [Rhodovulum marinum]|uniref:DUF6314 domain-containing protein n=1 Tax=Rhodovulum marinum TaxID=320662 RepID=A0A4V6NR18_9RHOB|nr:DUF6314 family protein [Rhodovulum marinum]TCP42366.1 hypothetical protein EV662_103274 [Rhodovulum marinum]
MPELDAFLGEWRLSRVIADARAGHDATLEGRAVFTRGQGGLVQAESGTLNLPGQSPMTAERRYLWRAGRAGIDVLFEDGRFFHTLAPGTRAEAVHDCPPDRYEVAYDFAAWPRWTSLWRVTGPRKDYVMRSVYAPVGACAEGGAGAEDTSTI